MDDVENLSTGIVENSEEGYIRVDGVENLSTAHVDKYVMVSSVPGSYLAPSSCHSEHSEESTSRLFPRHHVDSERSEE